MRDNLMLSPRTCGAHILTRDAHTVRTTHRDHCTLHVRAGAGESRVVASEVRHRLQRGEFAITDMARPERMEVDAGATLALFVSLDALDALDARSPRPLDLHGVVPTGACAGMRADHPVALVRQMSHMHPEEVAGPRLAAVDLLAASLMPAAATLGATPTRAAMRLRHRCPIGQFRQRRRCTCWRRASRRRSPPSAWYALPWRRP